MEALNIYWDDTKGAQGEVTEDPNIRRDNPKRF